MEVEGVAGAGLVAVTLNGKSELRRVKIDPKLADPRRWRCWRSDRRRASRREEQDRGDDAGRDAESDGRSPATGRNETSVLMQWVAVLSVMAGLTRPSARHRWCVDGRSGPTITAAARTRVAANNSHGRCEVERLIALLAKLPGLGPRSARRAALRMLQQPETRMLPLATALTEAARAVKPCSICGNLDSQDPCGVCSTASATGR